MSDVYAHCPTLTGPTLTLRPVAPADADALLLVYGDESRVPFFNSDNCHGDNFHYPTLARMQQAIRFWLDSYAHGYFVRWAVVADGTAIGTLECFHRVAEDAYGGCALLRIDLRADVETAGVNGECLDLLLPRLRELFHADRAAIKAPPVAAERIAALQARGFEPGDAPLIGHDGTRYGDYWVRTL
ncbi:MAG: GNAT family N-acetyltransferase [Aristaeellaceae bacterium]